MPIRVEQHSLHPVIYTFHNVLSDEEINVIKEISKPMVYIFEWPCLFFASRKGGGKRREGRGKREEIDKLRK